MSIAVVLLHCAPASAQSLQLDPTDPTAVDPSESQGELPVSLDRIKRALDRQPPTDGRSRLLNFTEFVVVVGTAPKLPLFGDDDLSGGPWRSTHADMMAAARPARLDQAVGSDVLGVATAALFALVPPAVRAVAGWFSGNEEVRGRGWAGYTETFVLDP